MIKHSASHGCGTLFSVVAAGILVGLSHRFIPVLLDLMEPLAIPLAAVLGGIPFFTEENIKVLILATLLALLWGLASKRKLT